MTDLLDAPAPTVVTDGALSTAPGAFPVARLLPDSVTSGKRVRRARSVAMAAVGASLLAVGGLFFMSTSQADDVQAQLDEAQSTAAVLSAQQAKYADVPRVAAQLSSTQTDIATALGNEVLYSGVMRRLAATTPAGITLTKVTIAPPESSTGSAGSTAAAHIQLGATATTFPAIAAWLDSLAAQKVFLNATVTHAVLDSNATVPVITVEGSLDLAPSAVSGRYAKAGTP